MYIKILLKIGQLQHWCFHQNAFQGFKGLIGCFIPFINSRCFFQKVCQGRGYLCKVFNELVIGRSIIKWFNFNNFLHSLQVHIRFFKMIQMDMIFTFKIIIILIFE